MGGASRMMMLWIEMNSIENKSTLVEQSDLSEIN